MTKKSVAMFLEIVPIMSVIFSLIVIFGKFDSELLTKAATITTVLAFFGFGFFIVGMLLAGKEKIVKVLGALDILSTITIVIIYTIAIFSFGL